MSQIDTFYGFDDPVLCVDLHERSRQNLVHINKAFNVQLIAIENYNFFLDF